MSNQRKRVYPDRSFNQDTPDQKPKRERGFTINPFHHHQGPFNYVHKMKPNNPVDAIGWKHDKSYGNAQVNTGNYWAPYYSKGAADDEHISDSIDLASNTGNPVALMYAVPFMVKSLLPLPRLPDNAFLDPMDEEKEEDLEGEELVLSPSSNRLQSFVKMPRGRYSNKRRGKRRRREKPMKRLSKLAIYKTIGKSVEQKIATYVNAKGAFNVQNPMTTLSSNNEYIIHATTLNDFFTYQEMANCNAGPSGGQDMDINYLDTTYGAYYLTKCSATLELSSFTNVDLLLTPVKITLKWDLANDYNSSIVDENLCAYNVLSQLRLLASAAMDPSDYQLLPAPEVPVAATWTPTSMQYPSGMTLPWKNWRKHFDIEFGSDFVLPAGKASHRIACKGKKGFMPKEQFWQSSPSSGVGALGGPRQVVGFAKKTTMYFFRVRQMSHVYSSKFAGLDAGEAYLGGPFRFVMNVLKHTAAVNMPTTAQEQHFTTFQDRRPQADNTTSNATAFAWADSDTVAGAVVQTV